MRRLTPIIACLALAGCTAGNRGMETAHQPVVSAAGATVPDCPDWSTAAAAAHEGLSSNYGCATMTNFAAMLADPDDLLRGHSDAMPAEVATRAIKAWREMVPTAKSWSVTTTVSTGGK